MLYINSCVTWLAIELGVLNDRHTLRLQKLYVFRIGVFSALYLEQLNLLKIQIVINRIQFSYLERQSRWKFNKSIINNLLAWYLMSVWSWFQPRTMTWLWLNRMCSLGSSYRNTACAVLVCVRFPTAIGGQSQMSMGASLDGKIECDSTVPV